MEEEEEDITPGHSRTADQVIGSLTAVCMITGLIGNITAFLYFWGRKRGSLHNMLYMTITAVDISTSLSTISIVVVLFNNRAPFLLGNSLFCTQWYVILAFTVRMSMFLVVLISVTRTINIVFPFHRVSYHRLIYAVLLYGAWLLAFDGVVFGMKSWYPRYEAHYAYCAPFRPDVTKLTTIQIAWWIVLEAEFMLPSFVVFISFTASIVSLQRGALSKTWRDVKSRRVSVTITLFTAVFLVCNTPFFLYQMNVIIYRISYHAYGLDFNKPGPVYWYGSLVSQPLTTFLNAALNPCLYFLRMRPMKLWICNVVEDRTCRFCNVARRASRGIIPQLSTSEEK